MKAAIFRRAHEPLSIESVDIDGPAAREVLVRTVATGVCHSDLHFVDGDMPAGRRPMVMGHEGSGVVEAVGPEVTGFEPGDHVVACLSGFCGMCAQCLSGHPNLCTARYVSRPRGSDPRLSQDGDALVQFAELGSFAEEMLVHENSLVRIDPEIPLDVAALIRRPTGLRIRTRSSRARILCHRVTRRHEPRQEDEGQHHRPSRRGQDHPALRIEESASRGG